MILNYIDLIDFHVLDLSRYLLIAQICRGVQSCEQEESRRNCIMLPGSHELRKGGGMDREGKVSLVMCIVRVEDRCDEKTAMSWLLGVRTELQRSSAELHGVLLKEQGREMEKE